MAIPVLLAQACRLLSIKADDVSAYRITDSGTVTVVLKTGHKYAVENGQTDPPPLHHLIAVGPEEVPTAAPPYGVEYGQLTRHELLELAKEKGLSGYRSKSKNQLIAMLVERSYE